MPVTVSDNCAIRMAYDNAGRLSRVKMVRPRDLAAVVNKRRNLAWRYSLKQRSSRRAVEHFDVCCAIFGLVYDGACHATVSEGWPVSKRSVMVDIVIVIGGEVNNGRTDRHRRSHGRKREIVQKPRLYGVSFAHVFSDQRITL